VEVHFFGQFAADGRLRRANMFTRSVPIKAERTADTEASGQMGSEQPAPEVPDHRQMPA
jgi:hypothetical protein